MPLPDSLPVQELGPDDFQHGQMFVGKTIAFVRKSDFTQISSLNFLRCRITTYRLSERKFVGCTFEGCDFVWLSSLDNVGGSPSMHRIQFEDCDLRDWSMSVGVLMECSFDRTRLVRCGVPRGTRIQNVYLRDVEGLNTFTGLEHALLRYDGVHLILHNQHLSRTELIGWTKMVPTWEFIRIIGNLPVFGISVSLLFALPLMGHLLALYNAQLARLQAWSEGIATQGTAPPYVEAIGNLHAIAFPANSLWLTVSTIVLGIASALYSVGCPQRVKEFTQAKWTDELQRPALSYLLHSWKRPKTRLICSILYAFGGIISLVILAVKLKNLIAAIYESTPLRWWEM